MSLEEKNHKLKMFKHGFEFMLTHAQDQCVHIERDSNVRKMVTFKNKGQSKVNR